MALRRNTWLGQVGYGALFVLVLPLLLVFWARATRDVVQLALPPAPNLGGWLAALGLLLMAWAMLSLWRFGDGLPMNAYPPQKFVQRGPYAFVAHPIYVAAVLALRGAQLVLRVAERALARHTSVGSGNAGSGLRLRGA